MDHPLHRKLGADGNLELTEGQLAFIDWLVDPQREGSQADFARQLQVHPSTLTLWKKDRSFKHQWEERLAELNVDPDRIQNVIDALYKAALRGDVKAMQLYLQYVDRFTPTTATVIEDRRVQDMTDEDIATSLRGHLQVLEGGA